jgi:glycosyltransferase involved in cell wall biosynthesis
MDLENQPTVAVFLMTYNESELINRCIKSIEAQKLVNIILMYSDNNSTDHTFEIVKETTLLTLQSRREPPPKKSPYEHHANALDFFLDNNPEIEYWASISGDDYWQDENFLYKLVSTLGASHSKFDNKLNFVMPKVYLRDYRDNTRRLAKSVWNVNSQLLKVALLFCFPRVYQPLCFLFSLVNREGAKSIVQFARKVEKARVATNPNNLRSPEFETLYSLELVRQINLIRQNSAWFERSIFNREKRELNFEINGNQSERNFIEAKLRILKQSFYMLHYLKSWQGKKSRSFIIFLYFLLPFQVLLDLLSVIGASKRWKKRSKIPHSKRSDFQC